MCKGIPNDAISSANGTSYELNYNCVGIELCTYV